MNVMLDSLNKCRFHGGMHFQCLYCIVVVCTSSVRIVLWWYGLPVFVLYCGGMHFQCLYIRNGVEKGFEICRAVSGETTGFAPKQTLTLGASLSP